VEQRIIITFLLNEEIKEHESHKRLLVQYEEPHLSLSSFKKGQKHTERNGHKKDKKGEGQRGLKGSQGVREKIWVLGLTY
jgi:hypothetical protein